MISSLLLILLFVNSSNQYYLIDDYDHTDYNQY